jgi:polyhydroxybutyrate depolymerase
MLLHLLDLEKVLLCSLAVAGVLGGRAAIAADDKSGTFAGVTRLLEFFHTPDGVKRNYFLRLPEGYDQSAKYPLLFVLHPGLTNGEFMEAETGMSELADEMGFIAIYPNGLNRGRTFPESTTLSWNGAFQFRCAPPQIPADVAFLLEVLDRVSSDYSVDESRVYMTGFSQGAQLLNTFVRYHPERVAAIAPVSGGWMEAWCDTVEYPCVGCEDEVPLALPMPVWIWRGSQENMTNNPKNMGRDVQDQLQLAWYIEHNRTDTDSIRSSEQIVWPNRNGVPTQYTLVTDRHRNGTDGAEVWFTEVTRESHRWQPGATPRVWEFLSQYTRETRRADVWLIW